MIARPSLVVRCFECGASLVDAREFQRICDGWVERNRRSGGSNAVRAPKYLDEWLCRLCVDDVVNGHRSRPGADVQWEQEPLF